jgi:ornithine cyclodeaminase
MSLAEVLKNIKAVKVFDLLRTQSEAFSIEMKAKLGLNVYPVDSLEEAVRNSDVISFATSGTETALIETQWIKNGAYVALSAPVDLEFGFYLSSRIVADNWKMHLELRRDAEESPEEGPAWYAAIHRLIAEGRISDEDIENLGPIALGTSPGRTNDEEKILLLTGGLPIEDITWGYTVYKEAIKKGIGQELTLWEKPFWA